MNSPYIMAFFGLLIILASDIASGDGDVSLIGIAVLLSMGILLLIRTLLFLFSKKDSK
jgi:hypothetical protein